MGPRRTRGAPSRHASPSALSSPRGAFDLYPTATRRPLADREPEVGRMAGPGVRRDELAAYASWRDAWFPERAGRAPFTIAPEARCQPSSRLVGVQLDRRHVCANHRGARSRASTIAPRNRPGRGATRSERRHATHDSAAVDAADSARPGSHAHRRRSPPTLTWHSSHHRSRVHNSAHPTARPEQRRSTMIARATNSPGAILSDDRKDQEAAPNRERPLVDSTRTPLQRRFASHRVTARGSPRTATARRPRSRSSTQRRPPRRAPPCARRDSSAPATRRPRTP